MPSSPERVLPYIGYKGILSPKGCRFSAVLDINRVRVLGRVLPTTTKSFWEYPHCHGLKFSDIHRHYNLERSLWLTLGTQHENNFVITNIFCQKQHNSRGTVVGECSCLYWGDNLQEELALVQIMLYSTLFFLCLFWN